jgi:hypothetical protein
MGKKRSTKENLNRIVDNDNFVKFIPTNEQIFFEFDNFVSEDVAEVVAIMMRKREVENSFWCQKIQKNDINIEPRKCLYWLSGGDREWVKLSNYTKPWSEVEEDFENEFKYLIKWIINKSNTLGEVRDNFIKYLNLPVIYEFALDKNIIK